MVLLVRDILLGVVLFSLIVTGFFVLHLDLANQYNTPIDASWVSDYQKLNSSIGSTYTLAKTTETDISQTQSVSAVDVLTTIGSFALEALKLPLNAIIFVGVTIGIVSSDIGIPPWITEGVLTLLLIGITMTILSGLRGGYNNI